MAMTVGELNVEIGAKLDRLNLALNDMNKSMKGTAKKTESIWQTWGKKIGGILAATFAAGAIMNVSKEIFRVTAEFQKMGAVLSNTLGSQSKANMAMNDIKNFAAETPFSVRELTNSFVKLANQGFKPTMEQMRLLGDLASSTGKGFDQLTEAIIDAQTGEFERLKEFGIRAKKEGDKVTFTFKEQQTQVDFTSSSIRDYILGLGELEGVAGANAKISETLGGKFSNLGDALDNLYNTIGSGTSGPLMDIMNWAINLVSHLTTALSSVEQLKKAVAMSQLAEQAKEDQAEIEALSLKYLELGIEADKTTAIIRAATDIAAQYQRIIDSGKGTERINEQKKAIDEMITSLKLAAYESKKVLGDGGETRPREEIISLRPKGLPDLKQTIGGIIEPVKELNLQWAITDTIVGNIANGFFNLFNAAVKGTQSLIQALGDLIKQLIATVAKAAILAALMAAFGFGNFSKLFGQALGFGFEFGGERASGGPVNFGQAYLVGERGPELFMPGRSGSIMSNNKLAGMGMGSVQVSGMLLGTDIIISSERSSKTLRRQRGR
jgi:hypothetical protein